MTVKRSRTELVEDLLPSSTVQLNIRIPVRLRARLEEFLQYRSLPPNERVPESEQWPTSVQALVRAAIEDYLAHRPLKQKTGPTEHTPPTVQPRKQSNSDKEIAKPKQPAGPTIKPRQPIKQPTKQPTNQSTQPFTRRKHNG